MRLLSDHYVDWERRRLALLLAAGALLFAAGAFGMAYVAGFGAVRTRLAHAHWWWLAPAAAAVVVAFAGSYAAYRGIKRAEGGPELEPSALLSVVTANFGGWLAHGGTALDVLAMRAGGASRREAKVRVGALGAFEYAVLAIIVCPASIAAIAAGVAKPPTDFTWPWALIPPPAFVIGIWVAERYRDRLRGRRGWRGSLGSTFFDTAHVVQAILRNPRRYWLTTGGMALYWGAEMFALWAVTAAFGVETSALGVILALGTGMIVTRRNAPLGGAGVMTVALVPTLWCGAGVPFAAATLGVVAYRFLTLWGPLPAMIASLPKLRELAGVSKAGRPAWMPEPSRQTAV